MFPGAESIPRVAVRSGSSVTEEPDPKKCYTDQSAEEVQIKVGESAPRGRNKPHLHQNTHRMTKIQCGTQGGCMHLQTRVEHPAHGVVIRKTQPRVKTSVTGLRGTTARQKRTDTNPAMAKALPYTSVVSSNQKIAHHSARRGPGVKPRHIPRRIRLHKIPYTSDQFFEARVLRDEDDAKIKSFRKTLDNGNEIPTPPSSVPS